MTTIFAEQAGELFVDRVDPTEARIVTEEHHAPRDVA